MEANDGLLVEIDGAKTYESVFPHTALLQCVGTLLAGKRHTVRIKYCQFDHPACVSLHCRRRAGGLTSRSVYLPAGTWMDLFTGAMHEGEAACETACTYAAMPLFVRMGALIPLAKEAQTTAEQKWDTLAFRCV